MEAAPAVFQAAWPVASSRFGVESASTSTRCAPRCASNPRVLSTIAVGVWAVRLPWSHSRRSRPRRAQSEDTAPTPEAPEAREVPEAPEETPTPEAPEAPVPTPEVKGSAESDAEFLAEFRKRVQAGYVRPKKYERMMR